MRDSLLNFYDFFFIESKISISNILFNGEILPQTEAAQMQKSRTSVPVSEGSVFTNLPIPLRKSVSVTSRGK